MASVSISCPSCSATDWVVRNGKIHCRKTCQL
ncbi:IS1 family transposase, partial [Escherichia coli]|nr:IS1 family transposase [Escherichia coli]